MNPLKKLFKHRVHSRNEKEPSGDYPKHRPSSADFSALIDAVKAEGRAYRKEEQREDKEKKFREWITIVLLGLTLAAIVAQVREMRLAYDPIRDQAIASKLSADAAQKAAEAAIRQVQYAQAALVAAQRAWVGPTNSSLATEPKADGPTEVTITYQNTGREPALGFIYSIDPFSMLPEDEGSERVANRLSKFEQDCRTTTDWGGGSAVYPTTGFLSYTLSTQVPSGVVDRDFIERKKTLIVQGCFHYRTFDLPKYGYFCYFYAPGRTKIANLSICRIGHDAD